MAPVNPAYVMQGRTDHPAALFRNILGGIATRSITPSTTTPSGGVNRYLGNQLAVTGLASMNVSVDTGLAYVPSSTAWGGMYAGYNTASYNVAVPASSSTQWRQDYIALVVTDPGDNTAAWDIVDVPGAFSSSAPGSLPSLPNNSIPLATIAVVPNMTVTNGAGTVNDARGWMPLAGVHTTTSSAQPPTTRPEGTIWVETDTHLLGVILNAAKKFFVTSPSTPNTTWVLATLQNGWTNQGGGLYSMQYRSLPWLNAVWLVGVLNPAAMSNAVFMTLPSGLRPAIGGDYPVGEHTSTPLGTQGAFLRVSNSGACSIVNSSTGSGAIVINSFVPLDVTS